MFDFEGSEGLPLDHFAVVLEGTREEVLERAVPFREGEEVYVEIIEPHMYSPGDAVAKVDGYMISITGGERFVGEKHLVRIEDAGRTSAVATLVDVEVPVASGPERTRSAPGRPGRSGLRASRVGSSAPALVSRSPPGSRGVGVSRSSSGGPVAPGRLGSESSGRLRVWSCVVLLTGAGMVVWLPRAGRRESSRL